MKIVHIGPCQLPILYTLGGANERRIRETAACQARLGAQVIVYSAEERRGSVQYHGAEIRAVACRRSGVLRAAEFMIQSLRDARREKPDIIHFHTQPEGAAFTRLFAPGCQARTILSYDFFEFRRGRRNPLFPWYRRALRSFSALLPVSEYCRRESSQYWSIPSEEMQVLYNGVSLQQFAPDPQGAAERRSALGIQPHDCVLLYVGRVCEQKGTDLLVESFARLRTERPEVRLVVAGPNGQFGHEGSNPITRRLEQAGGIYLGPVDEKILCSVYSMADIFVLPTRTEEMFGMAAIEAQACGRPVVCSDQGGLPEVVPASSGLLFRAGDGESLTAQLRTLVADGAMRQRFQEAALINARRFSWETITAQLGNVYAEAAA